MISLPDIILPKRDFFGLSIDRTSLRGIEIDKTGKVISFAEVIPKDILFNKSILKNPAAFQEAVKNLFAKGAFKTPYVVVCFPEAFAYTRDLTIPGVPIQDIEETVSWHIKDLFPFPQEDVYVDWKIIRKLPNGYYLNVVAVAKNTIDPIVENLVASGLKPLRLRPDASTIARLLGLSEDKHAVVAEINRTGAYVTLVEGEIAVFTTVVPFGKGDSGESFLKNVKQIIAEIISYYKNRQILKEAVVDIVLTGEVASSQWVSVLPQPARMLVTPLNNPAFNKAYAAALPQMLTIKEEETINLLPSTMQQFFDAERNTEFYKTILFRTCSVVGALCVFVGVVLFLLLAERQDSEASVKRLTERIQSQQGAPRNLLEASAIAKRIVELAPLRKTPHDKLDAFLALIPEGITITQWDYDDTTVIYSVTGTAKTRENLLDLKTKLEESSDFTNISLPLSFLESPENIGFALSFRSK